jgi:hypothetical protein
MPCRPYLPQKLSDSCAARQKEIETLLRDPQSDYFLDPAHYSGADSLEYADAIHQELEEREYYIEKNVFWVSALARWRMLRDSAKLPPGAEIEITDGGVNINYQKFPDLLAKVQAW